MEYQPFCLTLTVRRMFSLLYYLHILAQCHPFVKQNFCKKFGF